MGTYYTLTEKISNLAFFSRALLLVIQMVANFVIPDHKADAFVSPPDPELSHGLGDTIIENLLGGLVRWDAQYFIHIAEYGYTHENTLAFFPLYPMLVRVCSIIAFVPLQLFLNYHSIIIVTAVTLNFYLFIKSAQVFYLLSKDVLRNEVLAYRAAILFCINPASIFFSAPYSESLFAFCTFSALLNYERGGGWAAPAHFGLAGAARSNGLINIGFVLYHKLQHCSTYYYRLRGARGSSPDTASLMLIMVLTFNYTLVPLFVASCAVLSPFVIYQAWCYMAYCGDEAGSSLPPHLESFVRSNFLHSPDLGEAEWCYALLPLAYTHVQDKYWEVGLFRYYELRQLPNFLLAVPVVLMMICHAALYFVDNPQVVWSLGIPHPDQLQLHETAFRRLKSVHSDEEEEEQEEVKLQQGAVTRSKSSSAKQTEGASANGNNKDKKEGVRGGTPRPWCNSGICSWKVFVYTVHGLAVCFFCLLFVNVQVTTRLVCSSCPVAYWFAAHLTAESSPTSNKTGTLKGPSSSKGAAESKLRPEPIENMNKRFTVDLLSTLPSGFWGQVVISYYMLYYLLGTVLFANFLPWT